MYDGIELKGPIFEIGFKAYVYGKRAVELAKAADQISEKYNVPIIISPQYVDIYQIAKETNNILVFGQHCDCLEQGRGAGSVLPEALKEAGAVGVMLNHVEKRLTLSEISHTIKRADQVGLATMVCADTPEEAMAVAHLLPNILCPEPPDLIATGRSVGKEKEGFVSEAVDSVKSISPRVLVISGAGVSSGTDAGEIITMGADGTGAGSGIVNARDPAGMIEEMVSALKEAWCERHS